MLTIKSPISGKIGKSSYTEGALVTADQTTALATVQAIDSMYLDATRTSVEGLRLRKALSSGTVDPGTLSVQLIMEDGTNYAETGRLLFSDVTVDQTTGSVTLRSVFPNPDHLLLPGMFVRARFTEGENTDALLIPQNIVTRGSDGVSSVMIVGTDNKVAMRSVQADAAYGQDWIVTSGLATGDRVITSHLQLLHAGMAVMPVDANANAKAAVQAAPSMPASPSNAQVPADMPSSSSHGSGNA